MITFPKIPNFSIRAREVVKNEQNKNWLGPHSIPTYTHTPPVSVRKSVENSGGLADFSCIETIFSKFTIQPNNGGTSIKKPSNMVKK